MALQRLSPLSLSEYDDEAMKPDQTELERAEFERRYGTAGEHRRLPPQAPTSAALAARMLSHSRAVSIKRFDSADFFLELEKQKKHQPPAAAPSTAADFALQATVLASGPQELLEPPLPAHVSRVSGPGQCSVAPCVSPVKRRS
uniref:Uncharacterized protein n=1 Tax=Prymnesium polylepis TaxID=72548 RepID=A0A6T7ZP70_9EUKA|mmetsp:Transcript_46184/g.128354  ORF Transcript_46184/g.128354 Transcript_46184/m.128354 type:complete len:144 (+) Transcript_46184:50-481(+)